MTPTIYPNNAHDTGENSPLTGLIGQTLYGFFRIPDIFGIIPSLIATTLLGMLGFYCASKLSLPTSVLPITLLGFLAPVMAQQALKKRQSFVDDHPSTLLKGTAALTLRLMTLCALWGVPITWLAHHNMPWVTGSWRSPFDPDTWLQVVIACVVAGFTLVGMQLSLVIAMASDSFWALVTPKPWVFVFKEQRQAHPALLSALVGGIVLCYITLLPIGLLLAHGVLLLNTRTGIICGLFAYIAPAAAGITLLGHLGAAFASFYKKPHERRATASKQKLSLVGALPSVQIVTDIEHLGKSNPQAAIEKASDMLKEHPQHAGLWLVLAKLYQHEGLQYKATITASRAITVALNGGMIPIAVMAFMSFWEQRQQLTCSTQTLRQLAKTLKAQGQDEGAAWCSEQVDTQEQDPP